MHKIVLAHDSFTQAGGAERVVTAFHELFPEAPIFTVVVDKRYPADITGWKIVTSPLQFIYNIYSHFQYLFPLVPVALKFTHIPNEFDIFLSSSSSFAKGIQKPKGSIHIDYCHTPTRFAWSDVAHAVEETPFLLRPFTKMYIPWLRKWDLKAARNVDVFIANSKEVQKRIKEFYGRESEVIYPFVDTKFWKPTRQKGDYFLLAGRLQPHKNNELVINIFNDLGLPLHVVGIGRQEEYLRSIAQSNITFLGRVSDEVLRDEHSGACGYIYPQLEDAGMSPLEAAACGTATIGLNQGGSLETVIPGVTGELYSGMAGDLQSIIANWTPGRYSVDILRDHAEKFSKEVFKTKIVDILSRIK